MERDNLIFKDIPAVGTYKVCFEVDNVWDTASVALDGQKSSVRYGRGKMSVCMLLVGAGSVLALGGCSVQEDPNDKVLDLTRPAYSSVENCKKDWEEDLCEPIVAGVNSDSRSEQTSGTYVGGMSRPYWGPYFAQNGTYYKYDGTSALRSSALSNTSGLYPARSSLNQVYAFTPGKYTSTAAAPTATAAKTGAPAFRANAFSASKGSHSVGSRGGFGGKGGGGGG